MQRPSRAWARTVLGLALPTSLAFAQTTAPSPGSGTTPTSPVEPPHASSEKVLDDGPRMPGSDPQDPFVPVDDPMLASVPPATKNLKDWRDALEILRARSTELRSAHAQIEVARGQARMTLAASLPKLTGTGTLNHQLIAPPPPPAGSATVAGLFPATVFTARAELLVPLLSARNWYDYATAKESIVKSQLDAAEAGRKIIAGLAEAIVGVVTSERLSEVTRVNLASALSTLELNKKRERLGAANSIDVLRAEQEVARSRANLIQADETLRQARELLGQTLGYGEAWGVMPEIRLDTLRDDARSTCRQEQDVDARPDIRAARAAEKIAERNVNSVDYSFLPTINGQTTLTYSTNDFSTGSRGPVGWSIGGVLTWPLYEGGYRYGEKRQNEGLLESTRQQTLAARRQAEIQISQAYRGVDVARQNLDVSRLGREIAQNSARLSRVKFVSGGGTSFDMVDTQRTAREAELDVTVKEFELLKAEIIAFLALASCDI